MRTRTRLGLAAAVSCAALVTAVGIGRGGDGGVTSLIAPPNGPCVALGDSCTSAPKVPGQSGKPAGCERSDHNYPALVARELGLKRAEFRDLSCGGATTSDLSAAQSTHQGTHPAQPSAVSTATRLVTLGIGGNDIGFSSMITTCVQAGLRHQLEERFGDPAPDKAPCRAPYVSDGTGDIAAKTEAAGGRLTGVLHDIERRAPEARVFVVGYPAILPAEGAVGCGRVMGLAPGDVGFLRQQEQQLNAMLRSRAHAARALYIDTCTPSAGRDACAERDVRWAEPLIPAASAAPVHPDERGERGMAQAVLRAVRASG